MRSNWNFRICNFTKYVYTSLFIRTYSFYSALGPPKAFIFRPKYILYRSSHQRCSLRKCVLRNFAKFTGKHLCQSLFFNKVVGLPATLLKKRLWHRCFPVNFVKFLRTPFLQNTSGRLLLSVIILKIDFP